MTANQINFGRMLEDKRSNMAQERLTQRRDAETARNNLVNNQIGLGQLAETSKHNRATEKQAKRELREQVRTHKANEAIGRRNARSNERNATTNERNADTNLYNAFTGRMDAQTNARNAAVNERNAATNARNADINARNADTKAMDADTNKYRSRTERKSVKFVDANKKQEIRQREHDSKRNYKVNKFKAKTDARYKAGRVGAQNFADITKGFGNVGNFMSGMSNATGTAVDTLMNAVKTAAFM